MTTSTEQKIVRGKRYSQEEKNEIVTFIQNYNAENGRGGQTAAAAKFGTAQLTISNWMKKVEGGKISGGKGSIENKLTSMISLGKEIDVLERQLATKRAKYDALKAAL
jgi:transposase-like protein